MFGEHSPTLRLGILASIATTGPPARHRHGQTPRSSSRSNPAHPPPSPARWPAARSRPTRSPRSASRPRPPCPSASCASAAAPAPSWRSPASSCGCWPTSSTGSSPSRAGVAPRSARSGTNCPIASPTRSILVTPGLRLSARRALGWLCALLAMATAYVRVFGGALGQAQRFSGPMAKPAPHVRRHARARARRGARAGRARGRRRCRPPSRAIADRLGPHLRAPHACDRAGARGVPAPDRPPSPEVAMHTPIQTLMLGHRRLPRDGDARGPRHPLARRAGLRRRPQPRAAHRRVVADGGRRRFPACSLGPHATTLLYAALSALALA